MAEVGAVAVAAVAGKVDSNRLDPTGRRIPGVRGLTERQAACRARSLCAPGLDPSHKRYMSLTFQD